MRKIVLENKTGFFTSTPFTINDVDGLLWYSSDFTDHIKNGKTLKFNLPGGTYFLDGYINKASKPYDSKKIELPAHERNFEKKKYTISFENNPNKCSIFHDKKNPRIVFDTSFKTKPLYVKYCIYFHELGHHFYKSEKYADLYAVNKALNFGINKSQIGLAFIDSLSDRSFERKHNVIFNLLKKSK